MSSVAIIPARGGSKRIPGKNIKPFAGKPMIAHSIIAAQKSGAFDRIVVSTDCEEIARVAREYGAEIPFVRPPELSNDLIQTAPVLCHALKFLSANGQPPEYFACIFATAPFLTAADLREGMATLKSSNAPAALSVTQFGYPIFRAFRRENSGRVNFFWPEHAATRSQDLPEAFHDVGMFYLYKTALFLARESEYPPGKMPMILPESIPVIFPRTRVQDIDTPEDWEVAEQIFKIQHA